MREEGACAIPSFAFFYHFISLISFFLLFFEGLEIGRAGGGGKQGLIVLSYTAGTNIEHQRFFPPFSG